MDLADPPTGRFGDRWLGTAAEGTVEVSFVDGPDDGLPQEAWGFTVPGDLDPQETACELLDATNSVDHPVPFTLETTRSDSSWGTDGARWTVVLNIATTAIAPATLTVELLTELIRQRGRRDSQTLTGPEARQQARAVVAQRYGGRPDDYRVSTEQERPADGGWAVDLGGPADVRYTVDLGLEPELPQAYRIRRRA
jgi:hypothetical protein